MNKITTADQALVRRLNMSTVLDYVRFHAPLSRAELAAHIGLTRSTVSSIIDELISQGYVHETNRQDPKIGRPGTDLQLNPDGGFAVGVELGVGYVKVVVTNFTADILWRRTEQLDPSIPQVVMLECAENLIEAALAFGTQSGLRALGIGVGIPGLVDTRQGKLIFAPNLKWVDMPIRLIWSTRFGLPVFVENDANCATLSEYFYGAAHNVQDFIYLWTGIGMGGGIVIGGRLFRGINGFAGEIGHTALFENGDLCGCGRHGCWEAYVNEAAVIRRAQAKLNDYPDSILPVLAQNNPEQINFAMIVEAARQDDALAIQVLGEIGHLLGVGTANLVNIFNPELVILGGSFTPAGKWITPVIARVVQETVLPPLRSSIRVQTSTLEGDACVLGTVALVLDDIIREPLYSLQGVNQQAFA